MAYPVCVMKKTPANRIYAARLKAWRGGRTQAQAAVALGVTLRAYQNYEQGRRGVPRDIILEVEDSTNAILLPESDLRQTRSKRERTTVAKNAGSVQRRRGRRNDLRDS